MTGDLLPHAKQTVRDLNEVRVFLDKAEKQFSARPFKSHPMLKGGHLQTLAAYAWPRRNRLRISVADDEERLFTVDEEVRVLAQCRWQAQPTNHPTIAIWHGMEGSSNSIYMWSTAAKAFKAGFNVIRVNFRNCGDTEHLTPTLYHGGLSADLRRIVDELITLDGLKELHLIGFSLGGNMVLKLAGEYGQNPPTQVRSICAISPSVDLGASSRLIQQKSNWLYHYDFLRSLKGRIRKKNRLYPELYDISKLDQIRTLQDFDEIFTARANGFANAEDYYCKASCIRVVDQIRIPTLIIHAEDDPFIPLEPLRQDVFNQNPYLLMIKTKRGGHVAFVSQVSDLEDRFWAENRSIEFCKMNENYF